jgi:hypothetical protein
MPVTPIVYHAKVFNSPGDLDVWISQVPPPFITLISVSSSVRDILVVYTVPQ